MFEICLHENRCWIFLWFIIGQFLSFWYLHGMDLNFTLAKALYVSLFELLVEQINKAFLVGKRRAGWSISFPLHLQSGRRRLQWLCSGRCRLHPRTIFVTCSIRLISSRQEWLFKENEIEDGGTEPAWWRCIKVTPAAPAGWRWPPTMTRSAALTWGSSTLPLTGISSFFLWFLVIIMLGVLLLRCKNKVRVHFDKYGCPQT